MAGYRPGPSALIIALLTAASAVLAVNMDGFHLVTAGLALLLVVGLAIDMARLPDGESFELKRQLPAEVDVGTEATMDITLANRSDSSLNLRFFDGHPPQATDAEGFHALTLLERTPVRLAASSQITMKVALKPANRGRYRFDRANLLLSTPLGFAQRVVTVRDPAEMVAIPGIEVLKNNRLIMEASQDAMVGDNKSRGVGRGGEFHSLAPYVPGDPPTSVDWKAYARTGTLAVRRYEPERRRYVMLVCDAGRLMQGRVGGQRKVDLALASLARLAAASLRRGDLVGMVIFDSEVRAVVPPRGGEGQLPKIVRASLDVATSQSESAYTPAFVTLNHVLARRSLMILATDFDNEAQGRELARNLAAIRRKHLVIVAGIRDPVYSQTIAEEPTSMDGVYRQLASLTLLEERQRVYEAIRRMGVWAIDAEPDALNGPLLSLYGKLITSGRL